MDFVDCYLCGELAVKESVGRNRVITVFCTRRSCGRYDITLDAIQALSRGAEFQGPVDELMSRVYLANRGDDRILISEDDLLSKTHS